MADKNTGLTFDASTVEPQQAFDPIPAGWYKAEITDAEVLATKGRNGGQRVKTEFTVLDGEYKGRKIFGSINIKNANPQAMEIGLRELSALCHATGVIQVSDTKQFVGKMVELKVRIKAAEGDYEAANEPRAYKPLGDAPAGGAGATPPFTPGAPGAAPAPAAPAPFPPAGWTAHPQSPGWYYEDANPANMKTEADLQASAPAPAPAPPAAPAPTPAPAAPATPAAPPAAPVAEFPPAGWKPHPQSPGFFYTDAGQVMSESDLRAQAPAAPAPAPAPPAPAAPAPAATPAPPAGAAPVPPAPAAPVAGVDSATPPWER